MPVPSQANVLGSVRTYVYQSAQATLAPPLLAINSSFPVTVQAMFRSDNTFTWSIVCSAQGRGQTLEVYVFHLPETMPNAGGLLQLFNAQGLLVFDSGLNYCKVERAMPHTLDTPSSITLTTGRKYACVTSMPAGSFYAFGYPPLTRPPLYGVAETSDRCGFYMQNSSVLTGKFTFTYRTYATTSPVIESFEKLNGLLLIFDVTGM